MEKKIAKDVANKVLTTLDSTANMVDELLKAGKIERQAGKALRKKIDGFADQFEVFAFGEKNLKARQAMVFQQDADEPYMKTYDNPNKVMQGDADEPYMHKSGDVLTFDQDMTQAVTDRKETKVRDLSKWADAPKAQPSWTGGAGGASTRQGSAKQPPKEWAK